MQIPKPEQSAYETADADIRDMLDRLVSELRAASSWQERSEQLLEFIDALEMAFDPEDDDLDDEDEFVDDEDDDLDDEDEVAAAGRGDSLDKTGSWRANGDDEDDEDSEPPDFAEMLPFYVGAVLERLDEKSLESPEQAAYYMLSCHPEHIEAAEGWLQAGNNMDRFRTFVEETPDYGTLLEMMEEFYEEPEE
jgi:hypothetical protein